MTGSYRYIGSSSVVIICRLSPMCTFFSIYRRVLCDMNKQRQYSYTDYNPLDCVYCAAYSRNAVHSRRRLLLQYMYKNAARLYTTNIYPKQQNKRRSYIGS